MKCTQCQKDGKRWLRSICMDCHDKVSVQASNVPMNHYIAILEKAFELNMPEGFKTDILYHDKRVLTKHPSSSPFVWIVGPSTSSIMIKSGETFTYYDDYHYFYWDGFELTHLTESNEFVTLIK